MIRITKMVGKFYGVELPDDDEKAMDEIRDFVSEGTPVIIVEDLDDLLELGFDDEIRMVEKSEDDD